MTKTDLDLQIEMLTNQLEFAKAKKQALKDEGIELGNMIANAHTITRFKTETSAGDVYLMVGAEGEDEKVSFKLSRDLASQLVVSLDETIQDLDDESVKYVPAVNECNECTEEDERVDIAEIFAHPDIQKLLHRIFGTEEDEKKSA
jgi:hypothetical protein